MLHVCVCDCEDADDVCMTLFQGTTSLLFASTRGYLRVVKLLLEHKANIEAKNKKNGMYASF